MRIGGLVVTSVCPVAHTVGLMDPENGDLMDDLYHLGSDSVLYGCRKTPQVTLDIPLPPISVFEGT